MSIEKKSLISTLRTAKKANAATSNTLKADPAGTKVASMRKQSFKTAKKMNLKSAKKGLTMKSAKTA